ncbi:uncharacterized protein IAS62_000139 [Cryptococcus decagattii]|uniref:Mediator of RNA polymerase II transcription subunit 12 n=1 Tax=Cryptococcus decagattii TaxID=1859122 RepID=A0ABZ2AKI5_9TREE
MPPTQRHPAGINPYAPPHPAKQLPRSQPTKHPHKPHTPHAKVKVENFGPPAWRTVLHNRVDFGYPDFYPSRPGFDQPEDVLTEGNVKSGFAGKPFVSEVAETFSMHGPIHQHLSGGCLNMLMQLGKNLVEKQEESMPQFQERSFRIPGRVIYTDNKRLGFLADLGNPDIPLHWLMRNQIPHGFKGVELLDVMFSPLTTVRQPPPNLAPMDPIPIDRAIWLIRVIGSNDIAAHRARQHQTATSVPAPSPAAATPSSTTTVTATPALPVSSNDWYSQEFTNTVISWLRIQLGQLALPSTVKAAGKLPVTKAGSGILQDEKARAKWLAKWDYSTRLLRALHTKHLISTRLFTGWLADHLTHVNLAQLGFLAQLIGEYLDDLVHHLGSARHCLRAACDKLVEVRNSPGKELLQKVETMLITIIKALYEAKPDVLLSPSTWRQHSSLLATIVPTSSPQWENLKRRNEALTFKPTVSAGSSNPRRQHMAEIQKLDSICEDTDMRQLTFLFFDGAASPTCSPVDLVKFEEKVFTLLNWSMGLYQLGAHRPYAVYTLLKHWHEQQEEHQQASASSSSAAAAAASSSSSHAKLAKRQHIDLFEVVYKWLDTVPVARNQDNVRAIGITIGELTRRGMFSYGRYLQTLIANGQTARNLRSSSSDKRSHHLALLKSMPIFVMAKDLFQQRRIALSGDDLEVRRRDELEEEGVLAAFEERVKEYVPEVYGLKSYGQSETLKTMVHYEIPTSSQLTRYLYVCARFSIAANAGAMLKSDGERPAMDASTFARVTQVFRQSHGYATIADFMIRALQEAEDDEILDVILDIIKRDADVWTAMDLWPRLGDKLLDRHHVLERKGKEHPRLMQLLRVLAQKKRLNPDDEDEAEQLQTSVDKSTTPPGGIKLVDIFEVLPHILTTGKESKAISVAPALFRQCGSFSSWSLKWWMLILDVVQKANIEQKPFLYHVISTHLSAVLGQHGDSLDDAVTSWLENLSAVNLVEMFGKRSSGVLVRLLLFLISHRFLSTWVLLEKAVFPIWKYASPFALPPRKRFSSKQIQAITSTVNIIAQLLISPPLIPDFPPVSLKESLIVQASRQPVLQRLSVGILIQHLPLLVVFEQSKLLPDQISQRIDVILRNLAMTAEFKTAAFRNLNLLKDAFLAREWSGPGMDQGLEGKMIDVLKRIMSEKPTQPSPKQGLPNFDTSARFSAWRWTRVVLEMRVEFKALTMRIAEGQNVAEAKQTLNQLVHATLDRETTADDTDLLCEVFRGVDSMVTQEILAAGLERLATLLGHAIAAESQQQLETNIKSIDQLLRILDSMNNLPSQSVTEASVLNARHKLLDLLALALQTVERNLSTTRDGSDLLLPSGISPPQPSHLLKAVMGLLKFTLGSVGSENGSLTAPKPNFPHLAVCFLKAIFASDGILDSSSAKVMADMLVYIIDCTSPQARLICQSALLAETASRHAQSILSSFPELSAALPYLSPVQRHMSLVTPDTADHISDSALPLDDRHWELFEYIGPPKRKIGPQDLFLASAPLKDASSIPITLFDPKITRDAPPNAGTMDAYVKAAEDGEVSPVGEEEEPRRSWETFASERNLGDGLAGEPAYAKQAATLVFSARDNDVPEVMPVKSTASQQPVVVVPSSTSPQKPKGKRSNSSGKDKVTGSNKDAPIAVEEDENDEDSEVEAPLSKKAKTAKNSATGSGKSTTTAGKAPARKTTGGKGISKKATGKSAKESGTGRAKGGRRKSQAE